MMFDKPTLDLAQELITKLNEQGKTLVTAESCTGGLLVSALTSISGSSGVVYGGYATYANEAKIQMLGVPMALIEEYGAVSEQVARAMAEGALSKSGADISIAITGVAGPTGGTREKPVGLVHFACAINKKIYHQEKLFGDDKSRDFIRLASVSIALEMVQEILIIK